MALRQIRTQADDILTKECRKVENDSENQRAH